MTFLDVLSYVKDYRSFVSDDLPQLIGRLGDIHYDVGAGFLEQSRRSSDPNGELRSAITAFVLAFEHFNRATDDDSQGLLDELRMAAPGAGQARRGRIAIRRKAFETAAIVAVIYAGIEEYQVAWQWIERAKGAYFRYYSACREEVSNRGLGRIIAFARGEVDNVATQASSEWAPFKQLAANLRGQSLALWLGDPFLSDSERWWK